MSDSVRIDVSALTLGEIEEFEEITGLPISGLGERPPAKAITALVYLARRREDPAFTLEDARSVRMAAIEWASEDPTDAATGGGAAVSG